jgi:hypothetical protein
MFGFLIGTLSLLGLIGMMGSHHHHRRAWAYGGGGCGRGGRFYGRRGHGPWSHGGSWDGPADEKMSDGFAKAAGEVFKRRLGIDEDQEGIVDHALRDLKGAVKEAKDTIAASREEIAKAFAGEAVDDALLQVVFERHDEAVKKSRRDVISALKQVHAVLTPEQRARATEWLGKANGEWV